MSNTWIFQGNPKQFDVNEFLKEDKILKWNTSNFKNQINIDDTVYIWRSDGDLKHSGGLIAKGIITSEPFDEGNETRTKIKLFDIRKNLSEGMVPRKAIEKHSALSNMSIVTVRVGSNFKVRDNEIIPLNKIWNKYKNINDMDIEEDDSYYEGKVVKVIHYTRERNRSLINKKKEKVLEQEGKLLCEVCGFNFYDFYGEIGRGFCEVHHNKAISEYDNEEETKLEDLSIVCSNCHSMIHRSTDNLKVEELISHLNY